MTFWTILKSIPLYKNSCDIYLDNIWATFLFQNLVTLNAELFYSTLCLQGFKRDRQSSVDSSAPSSLWSQVRIPSTPLAPFPSIVYCAISANVLRKGQKRSHLAHFLINDLKVQPDFEEILHVYAHYACMRTILERTLYF